VKKIYLTFLAVIFLTISAQSFSFGGEPMPNGVWHSESPNLTLFIDSYNPITWIETDSIDPSTSTGYGIYVLNGTEFEVAINILMFNGFSIFEPIDDCGNFFGKLYFEGSYRILENRLYLELTEEIQERTGYDTIILELIYGEFEYNSNTSQANGTLLRLISVFAIIILLVVGFVFLMVKTRAK